MSKQYKIGVIPGDGTGPEVVAEGIKALKALSKRCGVQFDFKEFPLGGDQYLKKGSKVLVEGRLVADPKTGGPKIWQGQSGPGASFEVSASMVRFLSSRGEGDGGYQQNDSMGGAISEENEIPF